MTPEARKPCPDHLRFRYRPPPGLVKRYTSVACLPLESHPARDPFIADSHFPLPMVRHSPTRVVQPLGTVTVRLVLVFTQFSGDDRDRSRLS